MELTRKSKLDPNVYWDLAYEKVGILKKWRKEELFLNTVGTIR